MCNTDEQLRFLSDYLIEISLLDHTMMNYLPSEIAASAVYLSNLILERPPWDGTLAHYAMYEPKEFAACLQALASMHQVVCDDAKPRVEIRRKYGRARFLSVSCLPCLATIPHI